MPENVDAPIVAPSHQWTAQWIRLAGDQAATNLRTAFRATVRHDTLTCSKGIVLHVSACDRYFLTINGDLVGEGPPLSPGWSYYYDTHEMDRYLVEGANEIHVIVHALGEPKLACPMLLAELCDREGAVLLASGPDWQALRPAAWESATHHFPMNILAPYQEHVDAREPGSLFGTEAPTASWSQAQVVQGNVKGAPQYAGEVTALAPRDIPYLDYGYTLPASIVAVEESMELTQRARKGDVSVALSTPGRPLRYCQIDQPERLLQATAGPVRCRAALPNRHGSSVGETARHSPCLTLDFATIGNGFVEFEIEASAGTRILIGFSERLVDGYFLIAHECPFAVSYTCRDGRQIWRSSDCRTFRYLRLRIDGADGPVLIHRLRRLDWKYPLVDTGTFTSSDEKLNRLFAASRASLRLCSLEAIMDTPGREGAQWLGDVAAVTVGGLYSCFSETRLVEKFFCQTAAGQRPDGLLSSMSNQADIDRVTSYPDYSLWWVFAAWQHVCYTGNRSWATQLYPTALRIFQFMARYENRHGLIESPGVPWFIDHAPLDRRGICTAGNAIYYMALDVLEKWAHFRGDAEYAADAATRRQRIYRAFNHFLWDPQRGLYADNYHAGRLSSSFSEHANMAAVAFGLASAQRQGEILSLLYPMLPPDIIECEPFFTSVVLRGLERCGRFDLAVGVLRDRWIARQIDHGADTVWEEWGLNGSWRIDKFSTVMRTASHAWGAYPAEFLTRALARVDFFDPQSFSSSVEPVPMDFEYEVKLNVRGHQIHQHAHGALA